MVTFYDGSTSLGTGSLSAAWPPFDFDTARSARIRSPGVYSGDPDFMTSTSADPDADCETGRATTTSVVSSANPSDGRPGGHVHGHG